MSIDPQLTLRSGAHEATLPYVSTVSVLNSLGLSLQVRDVIRTGR